MPASPGTWSGEGLGWVEHSHGIAGHHGAVTPRFSTLSLLKFSDCSGRAKPHSKPREGPREANKKASWKFCAGLCRAHDFGGYVPWGWLKISWLPAFSVDRRRACGYRRLSPSIGALGGRADRREFVSMCHSPVCQGVGGLRGCVSWMFFEDILPQYSCSIHRPLQYQFLPEWFCVACPRRAFHRIEP